MDRKLFLHFLIDTHELVLQCRPDSKTLIKKYRNATWSDKINRMIYDYGVIVQGYLNRFESGLKNPVDGANFSYFQNLLGFLQQYMSNTSEIYKMSSKFSTHLYSTNLKVKIEYLFNFVKKDKVYYIEFADQFPYNGKAVSSVFLSVPKLADGSNALMMTFGSQDDEQPDEQAHRFLSPINEGDTLQDIAEYHVHPEVKDLYVFALKCLLYIESSEPDLDRQPAFVSSSRNPKKRNRRSKCPFRVTRVGYSFHGKIFSMDESIRKGHWRWQPHGPGLSKVKLIWIDETSVHYKNTSPTGKIHEQAQHP